MGLRIGQKIRFKHLNCSGCTGAAVIRGKSGEDIILINKTFASFCENYSKYGDDANMLPVDQHMLLAMTAPRPLYIASTNKDDCADSKSVSRSA